jgi:hypothetical protein
MSILIDSGRVQYSTKNKQYLFLGRELRKASDSATYFIGIEDFLDLSGLKKVDKRIVIDGELTGE